MIPFFYGVAIFISAFLLFFSQPMIAKAMLPAFGGAGVVWITTILFFQIVLLIGYSYAYFLSKWFSPRRQALIHVVLLCVSLSFIPLYLHQASDPALWSPVAILWLLARSILMPCVIISASSPLLQHWYCHIHHSGFPYVYYAISNVGSLIGLLGYPFLLEPLIGLKTQRLSWSILYGVYVLICIGCLAKILFVKNQQSEGQRFDIKISQLFKWLLLTFLSSALLISTTQFLVQNVMNLPLLWVLPLGLYLISYIVVFAKPKFYDYEFWSTAFIVWLMIFLWLLFYSKLGGANVVIVILAMLYTACMVCHGELVKSKPSVQNVTLFYLIIALGGVLGGIFSNIISFLLFVNWWDLYLPLIIIDVIIIASLLKHYNISKNRWSLGLTILSMLALCGLCFVIFCNTYYPKQKRVAQYRNIYGSVKIYDVNAQNNAYRAIMHGMVVHGIQFKDEAKAQWPTSYFGHSSGVGIVFDFLRAQNKPLKVGIIGLGCGVIAAYGEKGDFFSFYEIDPDIVMVAKKYFTFLSQSKANIDIILGDARIQLQNEHLNATKEKYNLLIIDAFNGDSIPSHLLTKEAFQLYQQHLVNNGILAFHTSNTYLDFLPVTTALAKEQGCAQYWIASKNDLNTGQSAATWALISCDAEFGKWLEQQDVALASVEGIKPRLWTDDFNTILPLLKWQG